MRKNKLLQGNRQLHFDPKDCFTYFVILIFQDDTSQSMRHPPFRYNVIEICSPVGSSLTLHLLISRNVSTEISKLVCLKLTDCES